MTADDDAKNRRTETEGDRGRVASSARAVVDVIAARPLTTTVIAIAIASLVFLALPAVDIAVSTAFYESEDGFTARHSAFLRRLREFGPFLVRLIAFAAAGALLVRLFLPSFRKQVDVRAPVFLLASLALGPGLLVNTMLKDHWGRARPRQVDLFGGEAPYTPVWQIADNCDRNCSFVSGEASSAIWLTTLVFLAPATWRKPLAIGIGGLAAALSLNRVAFGGHFLSDTILSWLLTFAVILVVHRAVYEAPPRFLQKERLEATVDRAGDRAGAGLLALFSAISTRLRRFARHFD